MSQNWRQTKEYRVWRVSVIRRDKVCQCCGSMKSRHAHHIKHATYYQKLRYDVDNGITLCAKCHSVLHNKIAGGYRVKCEAKHLDRLLFVRDLFTVSGSIDVLESFSGTIEVAGKKHQVSLAVL